MKIVMSDSDYSSDSSDSSSWDNAEDPPNKKYKCPFDDCGKSFYRPSKLENHKRIHTGEKPFKCEISGCMKSYYTKDHLKKHQVQVHLKNIKYVVCPEEGCGLKMRQNSLNKHNLRKHNKFRRWKFNCDVCKKGFMNENEFANHSDEHNASYRCDFCFKVFEKGQLFRRHVKRHKEYECLCKEKFYDYNLLRSHKKDCEFTKPTCNICHKKYAKMGNLKVHLELVHLNNNTKINCPYEGCSKQYICQSSLKLHISTCHMKKDQENFHFACSLCPEILKNKVTLWKHLKNIHINANRKHKAERKPRNVKNIPKVPMLTKLTGLEHKIEHIQKKPKEEPSHSEIE